MSVCGDYEKAFCYQTDIMHCRSATEFAAISWDGIGTAGVQMPDTAPTQGCVIHKLISYYNTNYNQLLFKSQAHWLGREEKANQQMVLKYAYTLASFST